MEQNLLFWSKTSSGAAPSELHVQAFIVLPLIVTLGDSCATVNHTVIYGTVFKKDFYCHNNSFQIKTDIRVLAHYRTHNLGIKSQLP